MLSVQLCWSSLIAMVTNTYGNYGNRRLTVTIATEDVWVHIVNMLPPSLMNYPSLLQVLLQESRFATKNYNIISTYDWIFYRQPHSDWIWLC